MNHIFIIQKIIKCQLVSAYSDVHIHNYNPLTTFAYLVVLTKYLLFHHSKCVYISPIVYKIILKYNYTKLFNNSQKKTRNQTH